MGADPKCLGGCGKTRPRRDLERGVTVHSFICGECHGAHCGVDPKEDPFHACKVLKLFDQEPPLPDGPSR